MLSLLAACLPQARTSTLSCGPQPKDTAASLQWNYKTKLVDSSWSQRKQPVILQRESTSRSLPTRRKAALPVFDSPPRRRLPDRPAIPSFSAERPVTASFDAKRMESARLRSYHNMRHAQAFNSMFRSENQPSGKPQKPSNTLIEPVHSGDTGYVSGSSGSGLANHKMDTKAEYLSVSELIASDIRSKTTNNHYATTARKATKTPSPQLRSKSATRHRDEEDYLTIPKHTAPDYSNLVKETLGLELLDKMPATNHITRTSPVYAAPWRGKFGPLTTALLLSDDTYESPRCYDTATLSVRHATRANGSILPPAAQGIVVALDLGTENCGYAFASSKEPTTIFPMTAHSTTPGDDRSDPLDRIPTALLLTPEGELHSFGHDAIRSFNSLEPERARKYYFFERFKPALAREPQVSTANNDRSMLAVEVVCNLLRSLANMALAQIGATLGAEACGSVKWVVLVPALWSRAMHHLVRQAARLCGLINSEDSPDLILVSEPEAASIYAKTLATSDDQEQKADKRRPVSAITANQLGDYMVVPGDAYLVVHSSASCTEIVVHQLEMNGRQVKELQKLQGGRCGSLAVDYAFEGLLCEMFTTDFLIHYRSKFPAAYRTMLCAFELAKHAAHPYRLKPVSIPLPVSFCELYKKRKGQSVEAAVRALKTEHVQWSPQGAIKLSADRVNGFFEPTVTGILNRVTETLDALKKRHRIQMIFVTGGFAQSSILRHVLDNVYGGRFQVIVPRRPDLAPLHGAIMSVFGQNLISTRIGRRSLGVGILREYDRTRDPVEKRVIQNGTELCTDVFDCLISAEQVYNSNTKIKRYFHPGKSESEVLVHLYSSNAKPRYVTDPSSKHCGTLRIRVPNLTEKCEVELTMEFVGCELRTSAVDNASRKPLECKIEFFNE